MSTPIQRSRICLATALLLALHGPGCAAGCGEPPAATPDAGPSCVGDACKTACELAAQAPSNAGCEFWAVDLDQQDPLNDSASAPWGLLLANAGEDAANVTVELNDAPVGAPVQLVTLEQVAVPAGGQLPLELPTRELDCGAAPNSVDAPGTCLSSRAFRITSSSPIVVIQLNPLESGISNDASLLLPSAALGRAYRVLGWSAGHAVPTETPPAGMVVDRSFVTIVGTQDGTTVRVRPTFRLRGNPPIAATPAGAELEVTLDAFDVLNLESDDGTLQDDAAAVADLSGTAVNADKPIAVFSGVEAASSPGAFEVPTYPGFSAGDPCCFDHLEEQLLPLEALGSSYVIARSPVRSTSLFREPDMIRFVGGAEVASITTSLSPPDDAFTLQPGEVWTTWTQDNFTATADKPFILGQILVGSFYVEGSELGDPSLMIAAPLEQLRTQYVLLTPETWAQSWVVITAEEGADVTLDGASTADCVTEPAGALDGKTYASFRCALSAGVHELSGASAFGIVAYGYSAGASYALVGGTDLKEIYAPPAQ